MEFTRTPFSTTRKFRRFAFASMAQASPVGPAPTIKISRGFITSYFSPQGGRAAHFEHFDKRPKAREWPAENYFSRQKPFRPRLQSARQCPRPGGIPSIQIARRRRSRYPTRPQNPTFRRRDNEH